MVVQGFELVIDDRAVQEVDEELPEKRPSQAVSENPIHDQHQNQSDADGKDAGGDGDEARQDEEVSKVVDVRVKFLLGHDDASDPLLDFFSIFLVLQVRIQHQVTTIFKVELQKLHFGHHLHHKHRENAVERAVEQKRVNEQQAVDGRVDGEAESGMAVYEREIKREHQRLLIEKGQRDDGINQKDENSGRVDHEKDSEDVFASFNRLGHDLLPLFVDRFHRLEHLLGVESNLLERLGVFDDENCLCDGLREDSDSHGNFNDFSCTRPLVDDAVSSHDDRENLKGETKHSMPVKSYRRTKRIKSREMSHPTQSSRQTW